MFSSALYWPQVNISFINELAPSGKNPFREQILIKIWRKLVSMCYASNQIWTDTD